MPTPPQLVYQETMLAASAHCDSKSGNGWLASEPTRPVCLNNTPGLPCALQKVSE